MNGKKYIINLKILQNYGMVNKMNKKCNSCGKFPFCEISNSPTDTCDNHIKREVEMRYKDGENFDFERIDK